MRISDWSSDVCSSDLRIGLAGSACHFHALRTDRHPRNRNAFDARRTGRQQALDVGYRDMALDHIAIDDRAVARCQRPGHAGLALKLAARRIVNHDDLSSKPRAHGQMVRAYVLTPVPNAHLV